MVRRHRRAVLLAAALSVGAGVVAAALIVGAGLLAADWLKSPQRSSGGVAQRSSGGVATDARPLAPGPSRGADAEPRPSGPSGTSAEAGKDRKAVPKPAAATRRTANPAAKARRAAKPAIKPAVRIKRAAT